MFLLTVGDLHDILTPFQAKTLYIMKAITTRRDSQRKRNFRFNLRWTFPCFAMVWLLLSPAIVQATVNTVAYWQMGENDTVTPFFAGILLLTNLTDQTGHFPLSVEQVSRFRDLSEEEW